MLDGFQWPYNVATCHDCGRLFCACPGCEPVEAGPCKECRQPLCGEHYQEAVLDRRGVCATCAVPRVEDEPEPTRVTAWANHIPDTSFVPQDPTYCKNGHLWSEQPYREWRGVRVCAECNRQRMREKRASGKEKEQRALRKAAREAGNG